MNRWFHSKQMIIWLKPAIIKQNTAEQKKKGQDEVNHAQKRLY